MDFSLVTRHSSLVTQMGALYLDVFEQPASKIFLSFLSVTALTLHGKGQR
jgi:hypothetical protein